MVYSICLCTARWLGFQVLYREAVGAMKIYKERDMITKFNAYKNSRNIYIKNIYTKYKARKINIGIVYKSIRKIAIKIYMYIIKVKQASQSISVNLLNLLFFLNKTDFFFFRPLTSS